MDPDSSSNMSSAARHYALCEEYPTALKLYLKAMAADYFQLRLEQSRVMMGWTFGAAQVGEKEIDHAIEEPNGQASRGVKRLETSERGTWGRVSCATGMFMLRESCCRWWARPGMIP